jgi:hypothetical protein
MVRLVPTAPSVKGRRMQWALRLVPTALTTLESSPIRQPRLLSPLTHGAVGTMRKSLWIKASANPLNVDVNVYCEKVNSVQQQRW